MNRDDVLWIEQQVEKKKQLYQKLRDCFEKEREALIQVEIDALWQISGEKDVLCREIGTVRKELADTVASVWPAPFDLSQLYPVLPRACRAVFSENVRQILVLKRQIDMLRQQNMTFMNESLKFMDQIMAMISGGGKNNDLPVYNRRCSLNQAKQKSVRFLRQEV